MARARRNLVIYLNGRKNAEENQKFLGAAEVLQRVILVKKDILQCDDII